MGSTTFLALYTYGRKRFHGKSDTAATTAVKECVNRAMRRIAERDHPYFIKQGYINLNEPYDAGVVIVAENASTMTGVGVNWTSGRVGEYAIIDSSKVHFLIGSHTSTTILGFGSDAVWEYDAVSSVSYSIYRDRFDLPSDFRAMYRPRDQVSLSSLKWITSKGEWFLKKAENYSLTGSPRWACIADKQLWLWPYPLTGRVLPFVYYRIPANMTNDDDVMDFDDNLIDLVYRAINLEVAIERGEGEDKAMALFQWQEKRSGSAGANPAQGNFEIGAAGADYEPDHYTIGDDA